MSRHWQGWSGVKEWQSLEGELSLACTTDGLGHVYIAVTLQPSLDAETWKVHGTAMVEAAQLDGLAEAAKRFVDAVNDH